MSPALDAFVRSWPFDPWLLLALALTAAVYLRGWLALRRRNARRWGPGRLAAFSGGLLAIFLALASPIEPFSALFLSIHMVQHLLLMMAAPPLLWLGAPLLPLLRGLPRGVRQGWVAPLFRSALLRRVLYRLTAPVPAFVLFAAATWGWHIPPLYDLALRSAGWHYLQHLSFLLTGLLFWYIIVQPYPSQPRWSAWLPIPLLILADVQNTLLSALLTFANRVLYPYYAEVPRLGGLSALDDQAAAGVLMWVPGSLAYLVPVFAIGLRLLYGAGSRALRGNRLVDALRPVNAGQEHPASGDAGRGASKDGVSTQSVGTRTQAQGMQPLGLWANRIPLPLAPAPPPHARFDLLRVPLIGRFLRWRHGRLALQLPLFLLAGVVIVDGLCGPDVGAMNLAGVLPWIHWRGLLVVGLLVAGNFFCTACPFLLPRTLARRWLPASRSWPRPLRSKWVAAGLVLLFLWAYEAFALWDSPWWTAWIAIGYFMAALAVDGFFRGASFCKYLCPIGQFNFVGSLVSPLEVAVRDPEVCASCRTKDCIPACELHLHPPRKSGNMDCTFCLDCIHACPHDNVGILRSAAPSQPPRRPDLAALVVVLVFGAFANAAGMVGPVADRLDSLPTITLFYLSAVVALPLIAVGTAAALSRWWGRLGMGVRESATRFVYGLVPLGFAMWLAHYSFHFLTSYDAAVPAAQRFAADRGWVGLGSPEWGRACCRPVADGLLHLEILCLDFGLLLSLYATFRIARGRSVPPARALGAAAPWAVLALLLFALGIWIIFQPMQMRGTLLSAG